MKKASFSMILKDTSFFLCIWFWLRIR